MTSILIVNFSLERTFNVPLWKIIEINISHFADLSVEVIRVMHVRPLIMTSSEHMDWDINFTNCIEVEFRRILWPVMNDVVDIFTIIFISFCITENIVVILLNFAILELLSNVIKKVSTHATMGEVTHISLDTIWIV